MAIYKPVSSITRKLLGTANNALSGSLSNLAQKPTLNIALSLAQKATHIANSQITQAVSSNALGLASKLDNKISHLTRKGLSAIGLNAFDAQTIQDAAMQHNGNLTIAQIWQNYQLTNVDNLSRKNFYILEINDRQASQPTQNGAYHSLFDLVATHLSFTSFDIQGEAVQIGSVEAEKIGANARTILNLTVFDDETGTIKQWAQTKATTVAASDGTVMPPAFYCFEVRIVFGTNIADSRFYEQIYTMRVQTMPHELSRNEQGLEEITLTFAQTDTFMPHWI